VNNGLQAAMGALVAGGSGGPKAQVTSIGGHGGGRWTVGGAAGPKAWATSTDGHGGGRQTTSGHGGLGDGQTTMKEGGR
jgi:hypothetical protein